MRKCGLTILVLLTIAEFANAQSFYAVRRERSLIVVGGTGTSTYFGELANKGHYVDAKPNVNVGLQYFFGGHISGRAEVTWFTLGGSDAASGEPSRVPRNLSFYSNNYEISTTAAFSFLSNGDRHYRRPGFNLYGFVGVGVMYYNPKTEYQGEKIALRPLHTELVSYSSFGLVIPYGLGMRFKITPNVNISVEGGYRKTFTDYLDDVSTTHKDPSKFSDPLAAALSDRRPEIGLPIKEDGFIRGNPNKLDGYMLLNAKVEYYLPWDLSAKRDNPSYYKQKRKSLKGNGYNKKRKNRRR